MASAAATARRRWLKSRGFARHQSARAFHLCPLCMEPGFRLGNVLKYMYRAGKKGVALENLKKAHWYLERKNPATLSHLD